MSDVALDNIPDELKSLPQWVCWRKAERDGKTTKLPINPLTGELASTTDSSTWATCTEACNAILRYGCDGIGFVFTNDDPYAGVDLDKCRDAETGELEPWAQEIVDSIQTFSEVSTSGTGVHCILRGHMPGARCRKGRTEMYDAERYFVMTGNCLADFPLTIEERQSELEALYAKVFQTDKEREDVLAFKPHPEITHQLTDDEIIEKAHNPKAKDPEKFKRLWAGDDTGYESRSEADAALCALLAFWTCHDPEWIDHLFRQSGLYRDKWEREDYRQDTIAFAIQGVENYYEPDYHGSSSSSEQETEREARLRERLKQLQAGWIPPAPDEHEPITADKPSNTENESLSSAEPVHTHPTINYEYFESLAHEPGYKTLCLPPHFGTMTALQRFICKHWHRGFVVATKTIEQAKRIASELVVRTGKQGTRLPPNGSLQDQILVLTDDMDTDILQDYVSQPAVLLKRYPIIVTTHNTLLMEPPTFFRHMATGTDQTQVREFVIICERPTFESIELSPAEYGLLCLATDGMDNVKDAIQCVQERMGTDNPHIQQSVTSLLALLAQVEPQSEPLTQLELARALYRVGVVIASRNQSILNLSAGNYTAYIHTGLLQTPHVWIIDGTADLTLKASTLWDVERPPDCVYRLVCPKEPVLLDIDMIQRNLEKLKVDEGGIYEKKQAVKNWIDQVEHKLDDLASQHCQILVVGWKDFKGNISLTAQDDVPLMESDSLEAVENGLLQYLAQKMRERHPDMFVFTTYQPGDTDSLIEQCEQVDAILFLGKFFIPPLAISELNHVHRSETDMLSYSVAEIVQHTFRTRCQFQQPITVYFTPDWGKEFVQQFLEYTHATDVAGQPLSVFNQDEMLERKFQEMGLTKVQKRIVSQVLEAYPEFEQTWDIRLSKKTAMTLLGYTNVRDLLEVLGNLEKKGVHITLIEGSQ